jgi:uncharacterized protein (TIGR02996 family)
MPTAEELAFLAQIRERPDDDGPRLIFADWLDEHGDSRGEFIRVQCALARIPSEDPRRADLELREQGLREVHFPGWTVSLRGLASDWTYRRGLMESVSVDTTAFLERGIEIFRHGPIRRVRFNEASKCFAELVDSPLLGKIREIDLSCNYLGNGGVNQLARAKHLANLELLHLGFNDLTDQGLRSLSEIPHLAQLRELFLDDNRQIGTPGLRALADSPYLGQLRHLDLSGNNLGESALKVLINGESLKRLDALTLIGNQIGDGGVESLARSDLLQRMLCRSPVLDLSRNNIGPIGARALAESPLVESLEELDLDINVLGDAGLASLAQSPYLVKLRRLKVQGNRIGDAGVMALARSRLPESLTFIDLTGNFVTSESTIALDEAVIALDWRRKIEIRHDPGLHLRVSRLAR